MPRVRREEPYWRGKISEWEQSGLTVSEFAAREGIKRSRFFWWKSELRRRDEGAASESKQLADAREAKPTSSRTTPSFVPVVIHGSFPTAATAPSFEVVLRSGHALRVPPDFDDEMLRRLVSVLGGS